MSKYIGIKKAVCIGSLFFISLAAVIGAGFLSKSFQSEKATFAVKLSEASQKPVTVDIARQGLPKAIFQPGRISISTGHGAGVANTEGQPVKLQVKTEGFIDGVSIRLVSEDAWDEKSHIFSNILLPGKSVNLGLDIDIPRDMLERDHTVTQGKVLFVDSENGRTLTILPVLVINGSIKAGTDNSRGACCE